MNTSAGILAAILLLRVAPPVYPQTPADLVDRAKPSVAFVLSTTEKGPGSGTAFVVHADGLLATTLHVVEEAREISVTLPGGPTMAAEVVGVDAENDLAVLRVPRTGLQTLRLADSQAVRQGEEVLVLGYPLANILGSYDVTVTRGIVSAVRANIGLIQVDAAMNPGVSGGPVMNARGDVVGIAVSGLRIGQQVNFAAPAAAMAAIMQRLVGRSIPELPAMRIPFTTTREMSVTLQKGLPANTSRTELGAQCSPLPTEARAVTGVRGNLSVPGTLLVVVWLSMTRGVASNDRGAFGHMGVDGIPPPVCADDRVPHLA